MSVEATPLEAASPYELRTDLARGVAESDLRSALATGEMGFLHSFTTGSAVDGPGIRVVAWTTGCQFRCLYCHNPDTWKMKNGMPVTLERAAEQLGKYRHGLKVMAGGLTLSGGEPLLQDRFAVRLLAAAKAMGIHTALDTNGALGDRLGDDELESIALVLLDIKAWDPERHRKLTGVDVAPVLEFARRLAALRRPVWLRFVLVPGWSDDAGEISEIADFAAALGNVERVDVLPFHQLGRFKWRDLGLEYELAELAPPTGEAVASACARFRAAGLRTY